MIFVGCDLHTRMQQVAVLDTETGERTEHQLGHDGMAVARPCRTSSARASGPAPLGPVYRARAAGLPRPNRGEGSPLLTIWAAKLA